SPLVFVLCRASSLAAGSRGGHLRGCSRDVRGRRRAGAAWLGCWWPRPRRGLGGSRSAATGGAATPCSAARRGARCRRSPNPATRPPAWPSRRPPAGPCKPPGLRDQQKEPGTDLASQHCWHAFPGVPGAGGRTQMPPPPVAQLRESLPKEGDNFQDPEEELALTAIYPNGDCDDPAKGSRACDGVAPTPAEPDGDLR
ncbi:Uncharacterized protein Cadr_000007493, partial [Camelus dromedarius]